MGFLMTAGNRHQVHSPFLYSLIGEVIRNGKRLKGEEKIDVIRKECLKSKEIIRKTDYGAGAKGIESVTYPVKIQHIARTSLTSEKNARRLCRLAEYIKAERILEIGTSLGITTSYLAIANPRAKIMTLEGCPELCKIARNHFTRLAISNIDLIEGRFEDTLEKALEQLGGADLVFVDGNHREEAVLHYFGKCLPYLNNDTVMIFDDIHSSEGMERAWEKVKQHERVKISLDLFYSGWIFFRKESSRQHFKLRYI